MALEFAPLGVRVLGGVAPTFVPTEATMPAGSQHPTDAGGALDVMTNSLIGRLRYDARTRAYADRRTQQGLSKPEIIRCLKRYVAREIYAALQPAHKAEGPIKFS
ncbi:short-chain dehydrogenase [Paenarthrobacter nicotinovorans]|uniref:hypothetical protein n=1 Tax=Paenarthrobacter nicotinovorans TaxID=29320 RepID=UPI0007CC7C09|nr:short-chain dehydrogenase [Paenarthrobacter nicotinovorans]